MCQSDDAISQAQNMPNGACDATQPPCSTNQKPEGKIELYAALLDVTYDLCDDKIVDFSDSKRIFLLKDSGKYYHWLKNRKETVDKDKPGVSEGPIPVTITSKAPLIITVTFKTIVPGPSFYIKLTDFANKYTFNAEMAKAQNSGAKDALFELKFTCDTPLPYNGTVQYLPNFSLNCEYPKDGTSWTSLGTIPLCLYITLDNPGFNALSRSSAESETTTLKIYNKLSSKPTILESLLYIGCRYALGAKTDSEIIQAIFSHFKTLNVGRVRDSKSMGYWRNTSSLHASNMPYRGGRILLSSGEARCGEWTGFLGDLLLIQSAALFNGKLFEFVIENNNATDPTMPGFVNKGFLVKPWTINGNLAPTDGGGHAQDSSNKPLNIFWDHVFLKYENQYFDPSYGLLGNQKYSDDLKLLHAYSDQGLAGVVLSKIDAANKETDAIKYLPLPGKFIEPQRNYTLTTDIQNKYRYKIILTKMEDFLKPTIYPR